MLPKQNASHDGLDSKEPACNAGNPSLIPGSGRSPEEGNSNPLQYSCWENPMDRGVWQATVHSVAKESDITEYGAHVHSSTIYNRQDMDAT